MRIDKINVMPVQESINPEILFEIELFMQREHEIPIEISGSIYSDENKKIANVHEVINSNSMKLSAEFQRNFYNEEKLTLKLNALLNHKVLDYIETLRTKNKKGDVILNLDLFAKTIISNTVVSPFTKDIGIGGGIISQIAEQGNSIIAYRNKGDFYPAYNDMWILSGKGSPTFIEIKNNNFKDKVTIRSSDWIHDYCPAFQIGRFSVFEYLLPEYKEGSGSIEERLNESINAIKRMEENMIKGDWNGVIEDSRAVSELLRNQDEIRDLLMRDGYSEQAFIDLNGSLKQLFNFASKFHHKIDNKEKKIMPEIKASKEDAYLIYGISINIVNLISKKMQKLV
jgi:hypothetical protein